MAKRLVTELFDHYHQGLIHSLPMKNRVFLSQLKQHDLLPDYVGTTLESLNTSAERASYFLDNAIKPSLSNNQAGNSFTKLLNVTAKSTVEQVAELAEKIKSELNIEYLTMPPTAKVFLFSVGQSAKVQCDGKHGGSYLWKEHDFKIILPPGCTDETITMTLEAYLPSSTQKNSLVSAVFNAHTNVRAFKKPVTICFPHCAVIKSEEDKENLFFLILHNESYEFKKGCFENSFGSIELTEFSKLSISYLTSSFSICPTPLTTPFTSQGKQFIEISANLEQEPNPESISKRYLDLLILPQCYNEMHHWHGSYCIIPNISTFLQCLKDRNWIHPTEQVLKREVTFEIDNDDALAEICIVDKDTLGSTISLNGDKKISKRKVDSLAINASPDNDADTVFETFPKCFLHVYEKIPSSSRLKIKSLCASEQESSEFNLATPTLSDHKFILHNDEKDTGVLKLKPSKPQELTVHKDRITKTTITLSWKGPSPPDSSIFRYEVEHRKFGEDSWKLKNIPINQNLICEVTELTPYTKYEFRVAAINSAGRGPFTDAVTEFTKFDCTAAVINLTKQLCTLTNLKYDNMKIALMGKNVITDSERREIDTKIGQEKMLYVIVDIVIPSLKSNFYKKYRGFLEAMEESYDIDPKCTAKILGGSKLVTWNPEE